ncbi:restriction endonuclease subunit S [Bacillus sp. FJAT-27264]|uniref:restriction endonuclease subunit S n=1 Tax=Paenibacillus sp. (strain DSM 101736 / FJAT-27264) TaxID=1850362 RepID=UPI000807EE83|nr:restriction endonuclease subunit S [Bacillus sp. FJAT-27264]OBZ09694.1 restriction endonuclease subunit S [Bacillus sp. FJAT-27264]
MSREKAFLQMLESTAVIQWNVAMILEAKAVEAEKVKQWTQHHIHARVFESHEEQLKETLSIHEVIVEMVEGLTKLENGLYSNLKAVLGSGEEEGGGEGFSGGDGFDFGDLSK